MAVPWLTVSQNPSQWPAKLLIGLEAINSSKNENQTDEDRRREFMTGTKYIQYAFNANQKSAAAANALCEVLLRKGQYEKVNLPLLWPGSSLTRCIGS